MTAHDSETAASDGVDEGDGEDASDEMTGDDASDEMTGDDASDEMTGDDASDERRLFEKQAEGQLVFVASALGIVRVEIAGDRVGQFTLATRCTATTIAAGTQTVAAGTDEDLLVLTGDGDDETFEATQFGPTAAVGVDDEWLYAASPEGDVARIASSDPVTGEWTTVGTCTEPRRIAGSLLAAGDGIYRLADGMEPIDGDRDDMAVDIGEVRDVAPAPGTAHGPFAGTTTGLYRLADGWHEELTQPIHAVETKGERLWALGKNELCSRSLAVSPTGDETVWQRHTLPEDHPVDIAHGTRLYAVTSDGVVLVASQTTSGLSWRSQHVGVPDVTEIAVRQQP